MAATILAREDELRPKLTGHLFICTGMPHVYKDLQGGECNLFPEQLASGSWETYKNGPVANRAMCDVYAGMDKTRVRETMTKCGLQIWQSAMPTILFSPL
jgi:hypothetical protein